MAWVSLYPVADGETILESLYSKPDYGSKLPNVQGFAAEAFVIS
jgi:hypothetical protein